MNTRFRVGGVWALVLLLCGCSTIIGADFDREPEDGTGGGASSGSTGGADSTGGIASTGGAASTGGISSDGGASSGGSASGGAPSSGGTGGASGGAQGTGGGPTLVAGEVFINEIAASDGPFIELYNASDNTANLEGATLRDGSPGSPNPAQAAPFAKGAEIAPHGYLVVQGTKPFGLVINDATTLFLVDATETIVDSFAYPGSAYVISGYSYGRLPDGDMHLTQTSRTLDAANKL